MNYNIETLKERFEDFCLIEEKIEAVYREVNQYSHEVRARLVQEFSIVKTEFRQAMESAIKQTSSHALESFAPADPFSQLLWSSDSRRIATCEMYTFQAKSVKEYVDSAFQFSVQFTMPGFQHLQVNQSLQSLILRQEDLRQKIAFQDESHIREVEGLRKILDDLQIRHTESEHANQQLKDDLQRVNRELQMTQANLTYLRRDAAAKEQHCSALQKENTDLGFQVQVKSDDLKSKLQQLRNHENELAAQARELETAKQTIATRTRELETAKQTIAARTRELETAKQTMAKESGVSNENYTVLKRENAELRKLINEKVAQLCESERNLEIVINQNNDLQELLKLAYPQQCSNHEIEEKIPDLGIQKNPVLAAASRDIEAKIGKVASKSDSRSNLDEAYPNALDKQRAEMHRSKFRPLFSIFEAEEYKSR